MAHTIPEGLPFSLDSSLTDPLLQRLLKTHRFLWWGHHGFQAGLLQWLRQRLGLQFHGRGARDLIIPGKRKRARGGRAGLTPEAADPLRLQPELPSLCPGAARPEGSRLEEGEGQSEGNKLPGWWDRSSSR